MRFSIQQLGRRKEPFANYEYEIFDGARLIARYCHDFRGDDHWIDFVDGRTEEWPVGRMIDFLTGGGPLPLELSDAAVVYLTDKMQAV